MSSSVDNSVISLPLSVMNGCLGIGNHWVCLPWRLTGTCTLHVHVHVRTLTHIHTRKTHAHVRAHTHTIIVQHNVHVQTLIYISFTAIREFTRETLVAVTSDIYTRNWRQEYNSSQGLPPEHPRSSTTDDVECFFSVLRDVGKETGTYVFIYSVSTIKCTCIHTGVVWVEKSLYRIYET